MPKARRSGSGGFLSRIGHSVAEVLVAYIGGNVSLYTVCPMLKAAEACNLGNRFDLAVALSCAWFSVWVYRAFTGVKRRKR